MKTKEKILKIAFKLLLERGFREVSINDLIKEAGIDPICFDNYFKSKEQIICESIEKFFFSNFDDILKSTDNNKLSSKDKLLKIFQKYSETEKHLKFKLNINEFYYNSIICLIAEGMQCYKMMTNYIVNFNNRLKEKIECIIKEGKTQGEISSLVDSKLMAKNALISLQNNIVLWSMNQNINIKMLFDIDFRYIWKNIRYYDILS